MADPYDPLDTTSPQYDGPLLISYPLTEMRDPTHIEATQRYYVQAGEYDAPTLNSTLTVGATTCYLVGDSTPSLAETGIVSFERTWMSIPATTYQYSTYAAEFPGFSFGAGNPARLGFTRTVPCQLEEEYFLVGPSQTYETAGDIPQVDPTSFRYSTDTVGRSPLDIFLSSSTTPTASDYSDEIGEPTWYLIVEPSELSQVRGNLWKRTTKRVRAQ